MQGGADPEDEENGRDIWFRFVSDGTVFLQRIQLVLYRQIHDA